MLLCKGGGLSLASVYNILTKITLKFARPEVPWTERGNSLVGQFGRHGQK